MSRVAASLLLTAALALPALAAQPTRRPTDDERGRELYDRHCASCHGARNAGDGPATTALVAKVPDLAGKVKADGATIDLVQKGKGPMPAFSATFDREDARRVTAWMAKVHTEKPKPADAPAAPAPPEPEAGDAQPPEGPQDAAPQAADPG